MENKKIAILMSTYNGEKYLKEQIESIQRQSNQDWHLYIRDDGSSDNTNKIISMIASTDERITFINEENISNIGIIRSFMKLLEEVEADFYMFSDQDDIWKSNKVQRAINMMKKQDWQSIPICLHTELQLVNDKLHPIDLMKRGRVWSDFQHFLFGNCVTGCTVMINQKLKKMIDFESLNYEQLSMHDWFYADIASAFGKIIYDSEPTILYRQHGTNEVGGADSQAPKQLIHRFFNLQKELDDLIMMIKMNDEFAKHYADKITGVDKKYLLAYANLRKKSSFRYNLWLISNFPPERSHLRGKILLDYLLLAYSGSFLVTK